MLIGKLFRSLNKSLVAELTWMPNVAGSRVKVCGATEAGILKGLVGDVEEELLLHVHARTLMLADTKVRLVEGQHVVEEVPVEGRARIGGDRDHRSKVIGVELVQEMWVCCEAGIMRLVLHECVPEGRETIGAAGCTQADTDDHDGLKCGGTVWAFGAGAQCAGRRRGLWVGGASSWVCVSMSVGSSVQEQVGESGK